MRWQARLAWRSTAVARGSRRDPSTIASRAVSTSRSAASLASMPCNHCDGRPRTEAGGRACVCGGASWAGALLRPLTKLAVGQQERTRRASHLGSVVILGVHPGGDLAAPHRDLRGTTRHDAARRGGRIRGCEGGGVERGGWRRENGTSPQLAARGRDRPPTRCRHSACNANGSRRGRQQGDYGRPGCGGTGRVHHGDAARRVPRRRGRQRLDEPQQTLTVVVHLLGTEGGDDARGVPGAADPV